SVLEKAQVDDRPSKPRRIIVLPLSLVLGLMAGCALALVRGWTDQKLNTTDDIRARLGMPVLCTIPHMRSASSPITRGQIVYLDPGSEAAEAYRTVRTSIEYHMTRSQARTLLITSPSQGDG